MLLTLGIIPILIVIHTLRPKPRPVEVTNLLFWQAALKEKNRRMTLARLKKSLPLLLQILILLLAALALAEPTWTHTGTRTGNLILVIDTSASMQTRIGSGSRFDLAKAKALELIEQRDPDQKIMIVEAGRQAVVLTGLTDSSHRAANLVSRLAPSDAAARMAPAVYLALAFVDPAAEDRVYLITDGAGDNLSALVKNHPKIRPVIVGGGRHNVGVTKFEFRQQADGNNQYEFMLEAKNFTPSPRTCPIRLALDNVVLFDQATRFEAREKKLLILPCAGPIGGIARATLDIDDDFAVDNQAYLSLNTAKDIWVLLVSPGNPFLEKLLAAYPNFHVNSVKEIMPSSWQAQAARHDIVIVDRLDFPPTTRGNLLLIDSYSPAIPAIKTGDVRRLRHPVWDRTNPLMADVDLSGLIVAQASRLEADQRLVPVAAADQGGLMYTFEEGGLRAVLLSFYITRSDLPLKVAFPVMMSNIFNWLNPHKLEFSILQTRAGEPFDIFLNPQTDIFYTRAPHEKWQKQRAAGNPFRYTGTRRTGIYTVSENNRQRYFTVNLCAESESDIAPQAIYPEPGRPAPEPFAKEIDVRQPLWTAFILAVWALLVVEWYFWLKVSG